MGAYVILQGKASYRHRVDEVDDTRAALKAGELLFSSRSFAEATGMDRNAVRRFMAHLEERELVSYPRGKDTNQPYPVKLAEPWCLALRRRSLKKELILPSTDGKKDRTSTKRSRSRDREPTQPPSSNGTETSPPPRGEPVENPEPPREPSPPVVENENRGEGIGGTTGGSGEGGSSTAVPEGVKDPPPSNPPPQVERDGIGEEWSRVVKVGFMGHPPQNHRKRDQQLELERMVRLEGRERVRDAIVGMRKLYPWSEGERPFDVFDLYRHLDRAVAVERRSRDRRRQATDFKASQQRAEADLQAREDAWDAWAREIDARWSREEPEVQKEIEDAAWEGVPHRISKAAQRKIHRAAVRELYGQRVGKPAPR